MLSVKMKLTKRVWDFLNRDVSKLFKKEYNYMYIKRDDKGRGVYQVKRFDKKTKVEVPYKQNIFLQTVPREWSLN